MQGKLKEAVEEYTTVLNLDPLYVKVRRRRAEAWKDLEEFEKALDDMSEAQFQEFSEKKAFFGASQLMTTMILSRYSKLWYPLVNSTLIFRIEEQDIRSLSFLIFNS